MSETASSNLNLLKLSSKLNEISDKCFGAINSQDRSDQESGKATIIAAKNKFIELLDRYKSEGLIDASLRHVLLERLLEVTYEFHKTESCQTFGQIEQSRDLPNDSIEEKQLVRLVERNQVISANETQTARLGDGRLVFCKNTKPEIAQLEIVAADFYRQVLDGRTAQGKVIVDQGGIAGMYVEAIPGFISMRQLTELAEHSNPYTQLGEERNRVLEKSREIEVKIARREGDLTQLQAELEEKSNLLGAYDAIKKMHLIDSASHTVNIDKLSGVMAKILCSAFFCQDWDRHKENFGVSFRDDSLGVASLDYDKSLSGIFGQDNKCYNWEITPQLLKNFPEFECWYWPTSNNRYRKLFGSLVAREKVPKMYSEREAAQYSQLKNNPDFQRLAQIEWLKLVFIPQALRESSVARLASSDSLKETPSILEARRKELLNSLVQLNSFREYFKDPSLLESVKMELQETLNSEEFEIVEISWEAIVSDINNNITMTEGREQIVADRGLHQLNAAVARSGISYALNIDERTFQEVLAGINVGQTSKELLSMLNEKLGLNITQDDARKIKEEIYLNKIIKQVPGLSDVIDKDVSQGVSIRRKRAGWTRRSTAGEIDKFSNSVADYLNGDDSAFQDATKSLRRLGIGSGVISDEQLRTVFKEHKSSQEGLSAGSLQILGG